MQFVMHLDDINRLSILCFWQLIFRFSWEYIAKLLVPWLYELANDNFLTQSINLNKWSY